MQHVECEDPSLRNTVLEHNYLQDFAILGDAIVDPLGEKSRDLHVHDDMPASPPISATNAFGNSEDDLCQ